MNEYGFQKLHTAAVAKLFLLTLVLSCGFAAASNYPPPPPLPPPPPTGLAETYYSTCGGSHPPLQYVVTQLKKGDPGYREVESYARSPEYRRYLTDLVAYKRKYEEENGTYGEVDSKTGQSRSSGRVRASGADSKKARRQRTADRRKRERAKKQGEQFSAENPTDHGGPDYSALQREAQKRMDERTAAQDPAAKIPDSGGNVPRGPQSMFGYATGGKKSIAYGGNVFNGKIQGNFGGRVSRNPRQDLARWLRGFLYHDDVNGANYGNEPERTTEVDGAEAGPKQPSRFYALLVQELKLTSRTKTPPVGQVLGAMEALWDSHWRSNLGFKYDPTSSKLLEQLSSTVEMLEKSQQQLNDLKKQAAADPGATVRLKKQMYLLTQEVVGARKKELQLRDDWVRRIQFVKAMSALLRLSPDGGFGLSKSINHPEKTQASARKILLDIGPLAGGPVWSGIIQDQNWLIANLPKEIEKGKEGAAKHAPLIMEIERRQLALKAGLSLLAQPRLAGYSAVCEYLIDNRSVPKEAYEKGFELIERRAALGADAHIIQAVPHLANYARDINPSLAKRARAALLKILSAPKSVLDAAIVTKSLAPLLCDQDSEISSMAQEFLARQLGGGVKK